MRFLRKLFGQADDQANVLHDPILPEHTVCVVGDVHGRDDLLGRLLGKLEASRASASGPVTTVFVGDYVDRGEQSAEVLRRLHALDLASDDVICLMGNHERMMLDFIAEPEREGPRWLRNGGLQTLGSFGVGGVTDSAQASALEKAADGLARAVGPDLLAWMHGLALDWRSGNLIVTHAALDPELPPTAPQDRFKLWGHPAFMEQGGPEGVWVAHGHVIVDLPEAVDGRISVDTGAVFTGRLTAAILRPGAEPEFIQA